MDFGNSFDDEKTIIADLQSEIGEENLLFFLEDNLDNKFFLKSGEAVTVGRSIESDFFIENKTVSRKHLTIKREGRGVNIEIHGRNGLYMDNELHMGPLVTINPPVSFTIGDVSCSLEFEVDEDKTIIVTPDQRAGMENTVRPQAQPDLFSSTAPGPGKKSFDPSPNDTFIPSTAPVSNEKTPESPAEYPPPELQKQEYAAPSKESTQSLSVKQEDTEKSAPPKKDPVDVYQLGIEQFKEKKYSKAIPNFTEAWNKEPDNEILRDYLFQSHFQNGLYLYNKSRYLNAKDNFSQALTYNPACEKCQENIQKSENSYKEKHYNLGIHYFGKENLKKAISEWKKVQKIDPAYKEVAPNLKKAELLFNRLEAIKKSSSN